MKTKKDFELVARILREADADGEHVVRDLAERFADEFAKSNPAFNRAKFLAACAPEK